MILKQSLNKNKKLVTAISILAVLFLIFIFFFCQILNKKSKIAGEKETLEKIKESEISVSENKKSILKSGVDSKLFVFIKEKDKENEKQLFTVPSDFYGENVSGIENEVDYINGNLYIIRKIGDSEEKELWKYGKKDGIGNVPEGIKLYTGKIFKFSVSPTGKYIAVTTNAKEKLAIIDGKGNILREYDTKELGFLDSKNISLWFGLLSWTSDEKEFWGTLSNKPIPEAIYRINFPSLEISKFSVPFDQEWDLNADGKKIVYSDCPFVKDSSNLTSFSGSNTKVDLIVYDVVMDSHSIIESADSKCFNPKWISSQVIEYDNPSGTGRKSRIIE